MIILECLGMSIREMWDLEEFAWDLPLSCKKEDING
jgi:hypothetical protein